jgi:hypothetical protein
MVTGEARAIVNKNAVKYLMNFSKFKKERPLEKRFKCGKYCVETIRLHRS